MRTHTKETQATTTPQMALQFLREGNYRFVNNLKAHRDLLQQVNETRDGQFPVAAILSCIDSRTGAELIFDQGLGDIFSIRLAGNVVSEAVLGSLEFACKVAGSKLVVVLGHTKCGAIRGACEGVEMGNLTTLLNMIQPSVYLEEVAGGGRASCGPEFVDRVTRTHVRRSVETVVERSTVLRELIEQGQVGLVGAVYDVETGAVEFLEDTFMLGEVKHFYLDVASARRAV
ncbi:MAG TPA: carbonic anhydrase family protein [Pyrinomonadaceae bacterium]|nr:carbonic anhydrase family protein [Pyrinomonadaceae bacterium]